MASVIDIQTRIATLREEAVELKDCFTKFAFQGLIFAAAVLGIIFQQFEANPEIGLAAILVAIVLMTIARIGTYKYASANRQNGYQLFLARLEHLQASTGKNMDKLREVDWEEAMKSWRVVQATIYEGLFATSSSLCWPIRLLPIPDFYIPSKADNAGYWSRIWNSQVYRDEYRWWEPKWLLERAAPFSTYYAGSYLKRITNIFYLLIAVSLIVFARSLTTLWGWDWRTIPLLVLIVFVVALRFFEDRVRRKSIEDGILSIHSCAIVWHVVIIAHLLALKEIAKSGRYEKYTQELGKIAVEFRQDSLFNVHEWIDDNFKKI